MVRPTAILSGHLSLSLSEGSISQTLSVFRFYLLLFLPSSSSSLNMTHFRSDCHRDRHAGMNGELRAGRTTTAKRGSDAPNRSDYEMEYDRYPDDHYNRVFDYQRVPSSVPVDPTPIKRPRPSSSSSSSSSSTAALRTKSSRVSSWSNNTHTSTSDSKLKMAELLAIKRELTVIKVQIDGLLDCVDKMDRQRKECSECPDREPSVSDSPHRGSVSSLERESPEPGEASEDEPLHYQQYYPHSYPHTIKQHQSDPEDDL
ncbi:RNA-binding Raly-like protein [Centropristis striata]|uniref:RNA-binding Raly-like protein n=1 Tax=Centropristis striata TaxID=184440 RepID=UPI0027E1E0EF|nr:RNA-binding Raly-like protein [Centropristis striata]